MLVRPTRPTKPTSTQYGQPAQGSPVCEEGTVVGVTTVVVVVVVMVQLVGTVILLSSRLTWPFRARTRPSTVVPVWTDAEVRAKMLPTKVVFVPNVAELPTCQKTLHA
jgi:hypothetical protein